MTHGSLLNENWNILVERLGGVPALEAGARESGAFVRARKVRSAVDLLRFTLAYCLSEMGLRLTAAWGSAMGLADLSNVALLGRLRNMDGWLTRLVAEALAAQRPRAAEGRLIRVIDATTVPQAGRNARGGQALWRLHGVLEVSTEHFGFVQLTDGRGGERFDRAPVVAGEIRIGDRAYAQPDRLAAVIEGGGDVAQGRVGTTCAGWRRTAHGSI
jgi:hypothetical protein